MEFENIREFAELLKDTKYVWWTVSKKESNYSPSYINEIPKIEFIKQNGINNSGFINLLRQKSGKKVIGNGEIKDWFDYFECNKLIHEFDYKVDYPIGTLFIRKYYNVQDQGHLAVYYSKGKDNNVFFGNIIHAYSNNNSCVGITNFGESYFSYENGYYEYIVLPKDWL